MYLHIILLHQLGIRLVTYWNIVAVLVTCCP